jgi:hypothetical protein
MGPSGRRVSKGLAIFDCRLSIAPFSETSCNRVIPSAARNLALPPAGSGTKSHSEIPRCARNDSGPRRAD